MNNIGTHARIIGAFPGTGKSWLYEHQNDYNLTILDSDSSHFSWIKDEYGKNTTIRNPEFPMNYMDHIIANINKADIICISTHSEVRKALADLHMVYEIYYPQIVDKAEWMERYKQRGSSEGFIKMMDNNFVKFVEEIDNEKIPMRHQLKANEYLIDRIFK